MQSEENRLLIFFLVTTFLILVLAGFIVTILYLYQKKQLTFQKNLEEIRLNHEKSILKTQLEIQEQTFQKISKEIHDNIGLSLTLAKLHLNTITAREDSEKMNASIKCLSDAIKDLSDLSKSLNSEFIAKNGFLRALETEIDLIARLGTYVITFLIDGEPFYLEVHREIVLFRIAQEALQNILKHSRSTTIRIFLKYNKESLTLIIGDNGVGFNQDYIEHKKAGLKNMKQRAEMIQANFSIDTCANSGTTVQVLIPINN